MLKQSNNDGDERVRSIVDSTTPGQVVLAYRGKQVSRSLSLRPSWSAEKVSDQPCLGSEGQKGGENVIEQAGHVLTPESSKT